MSLPHFKFDHSNFTVFDIDRSLKFYEEALGLTEFARLETKSYIFVECGPGKTLCGFNRRIDKTIKSFNVENIESLKKTAEDLKNV